MTRWFFILLYRWFPSILQVLTIIRPETLVGWHRAGFRCYWRWKSRPRGGRPQIETDLCGLIRRMSIENPLWGAPSIHGELLKLGFEVAQSSVAQYMVKRRGPPSQGWRTFLRNHAPDVAAMDLFVVPTIGFDLLYAYIIVRLDRRELVWVRGRFPCLRTKPVPSSNRHRFSSRPAESIRRRPWCRDTFRPLLKFPHARTGKAPSRLAITDLDAELVVAFLDGLADQHAASTATYNLRLPRSAPSSGLWHLRSPPTAGGSSASHCSKQDRDQARGLLPASCRDRGDPDGLKLAAGCKSKMAADRNHHQ
jgi:hypothetical protein